MKIGIDARTILNPEKGDAIGVGHYTYQLIRHLLDLDKENQYVLFFDSRVREKDVKKFTKSNVKIKFYPFSDYKKYMPVAYNEILGTATLLRENLDVLHSTSPSSRIPTSYKGKTIVTIHDLTSYKVPEVYPKLKRTKYKAMLNMMTSKADKIIAVSQSTKKDLCDIYGCYGEKVNVVYAGFDKRLFEESKISKQKVLEKFGIDDGGKYILFLGTIEPLKNITRLLEAYKIFKEKCKSKNGKCEHKLVLAGKSGWLSDEYKKQVKDMGFSKDVIFTGYITGDDLAPLFRNAEFFVMPSLYEGFGTTVLEAFATGTPAIVSNVSSIPELSGDGAYLVNPLDTQEIAEAMIRFSEDENFRKSFIEKGKKQLEKFSWEKCARETLEVYKSLAK